ncbi:MAG: hypothetical protein ABJF11_19505 [Reichenbachiella sp.]|uniref:hypothetical protein n=1 Tax=Reichenbachiella sp. TaxID=2184521 RepID=UPI00326534A7
MSRYPFEEKAFDKIQFDLPANLLELNSRLNTSARDLGQSNIDYKITSLLTVFCGNIEWYVNRIRKEKYWLRTYNFTTIALIVLLPFLILYFTHFIEAIGEKIEWESLTKASKQRDSLEYYSALIIAIFTSLLGLHKVFTSWLSKRQLLSIFHEASSELKSKFYAFEDEWNSKDLYTDAVGNTVLPDFDEAVEKAITEGRAIANAERLKYYEAIQNPGMDLSSILSNSFTQASALMKNFQSKRFVRMLEDTESHQKNLAEIKALEAKLNLLREWMTMVDADLVRIPGDRVLTQRKDDLRKQMDAVELALIQKKVVNN